MISWVSTFFGVVSTFFKVVSFLVCSEVKRIESRLYVVPHFHIQKCDDCVSLHYQANRHPLFSQLISFMHFNKIKIEQIDERMIP